jgi:small-conductance mechanosensitive channel
MLLQAAVRTPLVERSPAPFVLQRALGDFAVQYELNAYLREPDPDRILNAYSELHKNVQDVFNEYGVQIMTPNYMADTARPKLVPREQWFAAPAKPER